MPRAISRVKSYPKEGIKEVSIQLRFCYSPECGDTYEIECWHIRSNAAIDSLQDIIDSSDLTQSNVEAAKNLRGYLYQHRDDLNKLKEAHGYINIQVQEDFDDLKLDDFLEWAEDSIAEHLDNIYDALRKEFHELLSSGNLPENIKQQLIDMIRDEL